MGALAPILFSNGALPTFKTDVLCTEFYNLEEGGHILLAAYTNIWATVYCPHT